MLRPLTTRFVIAVVLALGLSGCPVSRSAIAWFYSNDDLLVLDRDARVRYEAGAALLAEKVADVLPKAMSTVEAAQYRSFSADVRIFVFSKTENFSARSGGLPIMRGNTFNRAIYLSPRLQPIEQYWSAFVAGVRANPALHPDDPQAARRSLR